MGGSLGGGISPDTLRRLEETAKQKLREASAGTTAHIFISFAHEDIDEVNPT